MTILVIGSGSIGIRHGENLLALGQKAEALSVRAAGVGGALRRIGAGGLRGVVIATETQLRLPLIAACADADLPVYIEKPLASGVDEVAAIYAATAGIAARSVVGFMMRYHPAFRHLAQAALGDCYRFSFDIGHDVTRWRANWHFADSYAARPDGGGVLLDLCHELDMAACLFPASTLAGVESLGHSRYPGVDMASRITLQGQALGTVTMDYLSPVSTRRIDIASPNRRWNFDLASGICSVATETGTSALSFPFERNQMFLEVMRDWLALVDGKPVSDVQHLPRLDLVQRNCQMIAAAYEARHFVGELSGEKP